MDGIYSEANRNANDIESLEAKQREALALKEI